MSKPDPRVTKRKVTCYGVTMVIVDGKKLVQEYETVDYVLPEILDAYVQHAQERGFTVDVGGVDAGPAGYDGATYVPHGNVVENFDGTFTYVPFPHRLAGSYRPATGEKHHPDDPSHPDNRDVSPNNPIATAHHLGVPLDDVQTAFAELNDHPKVQAHQRRLARQTQES